MCCTKALSLIEGAILASRYTHTEVRPIEQFPGYSYRSNSRRLGEASLSCDATGLATHEHFPVPQPVEWWRSAPNQKRKLGMPHEDGAQKLPHCFNNTSDYEG